MERRTSFVLAFTILLFASCENATDNLLDKDPVTDTDTIAATDSSLNDSYQNDADFSDETLEEDSYPDELQSDDDAYIPFCGNGVVDPDEKCDDGNTNNTDVCKNDCTNNVCGDGALHVGVEICELGQETTCDLALDTTGTDGTVPCNFTCDGWTTDNNCTRTFTCEDKPAHTLWNSVSSYTQTWNGDVWVPQDTITSYNTTTSTMECFFICDESYVWNDSQCTYKSTHQWGAGSQDVGNSMALDGDGNIYITGNTAGDLDGNTSAGSMDVFLVKWSADGTKDWTKQWGTLTEDYGVSVAIDTLGNIYVTGNTNGNLDGNTHTGDADIFLTKWNADGSKAWTKQWGTTLEDDGYEVAVDGSGAVYVAGRTDGDLDGNTNAQIGLADIFLTKWTADGTKIWTKQWGSDADDYAYSVAVDGAGNIFITGTTWGSLDGNVAVGSSDLFVTKWNANGTKAWTQQEGTTDDDYGTSVVVDGSGTVYVTGRINDAHVFLAKWSGSGDQEWRNDWPTPSSDLATSVAVDMSGAIYVAGHTMGNLNGNINAGQYDVFLAQWQPDGSTTWIMQWGTSENDFGASVAVDQSGTIYVMGTTWGDLDGNTSSGNADIFFTTVKP